MEDRGSHGSFAMAGEWPIWLQRTDGSAWADTARSGDLGQAARAWRCGRSLRVVGSGRQAQQDQRGLGAEFGGDQISISVTLR